MSVTSHGTCNDTTQTVSLVYQHFLHKVRVNGAKLQDIDPCPRRHSVEERARWLFSLASRSNTHIEDNRG